MVLELPPELHLEDEAGVRQVIVGSVIGVLGKTRLVLIGEQLKAHKEMSFSRKMVKIGFKPVVPPKRF